MSVTLSPKGTLHPTNESGDGFTISSGGIQKPLEETNDSTKVQTNDSKPKVRFTVSGGDYCGPLEGAPKQLSAGNPPQFSSPSKDTTKTKYCSLQLFNSISLWGKAKREQNSNLAIKGAIWVIVAAGMVLCGLSFLIEFVARFLFDSLIRICGCTKA